MKLLTLLAPALAIGAAAMAVPALAQPPHTTTTVHQVHGPLRILPHHNRKICRTRYVHHRRSKKCWYH